jgi:hypothetical protein
LRPPVPTATAECESIGYDGSSTEMVHPTTVAVADLGRRSPLRQSPDRPRVIAVALLLQLEPGTFFRDMCPRRPSSST